MAPTHDRTDPGGGPIGDDGWSLLFRALVDQAMSQMVIVHDEQGRFVDVNVPACANLGFSRDELLGMNVVDVERDIDLATAREAWAQMPLGTRGTYSGHHRRKDGAIVPVQVSVCVVEQRGRKLFLGVGIDQSGRDALESPPAKGVSQFAGLWELSDVGIGISRLSDGCFVDVNPAFERIYGYPKAEVVGRTSAQLGLWADPDARAGMIERLRRGEDVRGFEMTCRRQSGELGRLSVSARIVPLAGEPHVLGIVHDVTGHWLSERAMRLQQARLLQFVEHSPMALAMFDRRMCYLAASARWRADYGVQAQSLVGRPHYEVFPEIGEDWKAVHRRGLAGEVVGREEDPFERADGSVQWLRWEVRPWFEGSGEIGGILILTEDITARKRAESELQRHQLHLEDLVRERTAELDEARRRAESANVAKSAFLANISHEIRTPLNAITGMTHMLRQGPLTPLQEDRLRKIDTASAHLLEIINAVLDLSKIEAGRFELERGPVQPDAIVHGIVALLRDRATAKGLALRVSAPAFADEFVGDATRLGQALLNYVVNAIKFTERGGIVVSVRVVEETAQAATLRFEVGDTGVGIAPEALARLFVPFEQADSSSTRRHGGSGLGLAITRRLAELMGGQAGALSDPGLGSTFWFTVRLHKSGASAARSPEPGGDAPATLRRLAAGKRVLLAEDDPINQEVAGYLLGELGLAVTCVGDGEEALQAARREPFDLVVLDLQMPRLGGLETTRRMRALPAYAHTPIVAMTANAFDEDRQRCRDAGMDDFVAKPVDPKALHDTVWRCLRLAATSRARSAQALPDDPSAPP